MSSGFVELEPGFIDTEDIVAKLHFLEHMEQRWPYNPAKGVPLTERVTRSLARLPRELQKYALAVFANVVYLPDMLLKESWSYLAETIAQKIGISIYDLFQKSHLLEVDPSGLISDLLHENNIHGRLDTDRFSRLQSIEGLAEGLQVFGHSDKPEENLAREIQLAFNKPYWLVISDNILSGTSLKSYLNRCRRLICAYEHLGKPKLIPIGQVITSAAEDNLGGEEEISFALRFDERFRVRLDNEECAFFSKKETLNGVIRLSEWLAKQEGFVKDERLVQTIAMSGDNMALGFKGGGWTIVTPNCPTNSLPILWYEQKGLYEGPFPRIMSRLSQAKGGGEGMTEGAIAVAPRVLRKLGYKG